MIRWVASGWLASLALPVAAPSPAAAQTTVDTAAAIQAADSAGQLWLQFVDKKQLAESWDEAALAFKQAVTRERWLESVKAARDPFEPFGARRRVQAQYSTALPGAPPGRYVVLQYRTVVSGGVEVVETVVPTLDGARGWRVSGYYVRPGQ